MVGVLEERPVCLRPSAAAHQRAASQAQLVDAVLTPGAAGVPRVAINTGVTTTERDEQKGFAALAKGWAACTGIRRRMIPGSTAWWATRSYWNC